MSGTEIERFGRFDSIGEIKQTSKIWNISDRSQSNADEHSIERATMGKARAREKKENGGRKRNEVIRR